MPHTRVGIVAFCTVGILQTFGRKGQKLRQIVLLAVWWEACGILAPRPGMEPVPPAVEAQSLNHWTTREVPSYFQLNLSFIISKVFLCLSYAIPLQVSFFILFTCPSLILSAN